MGEEITLYNRKQQIKWVTSIVAVFIFWALTSKILDAINFVYASNKDISVLQKAIIKPDFIPDNYKIEKVMSKEFLITAWDINHRTPRFFTKWAKKNIKNDPR